MSVLDRCPHRRRHYDDVTFMTPLTVLRECSVAHQPDQTGFTLCRFTYSGFGIHLMIAVSVIKRLSLYELTLWVRDLVSVVRIRESPYYRDFL